MKTPISEKEALKKSLRKAYFQKEGLETGDRWRLKTMTRIRAIGSQKAKADFWLGLGQLAWRLSPITCALIVLCTLVLLGSDAFHDYEVLSVFATDPKEVSLSQIIGIGAS